MKKIKSILILLILVTVLSGCGNKDVSKTANISSGNTVQEVLDQKISGKTEDSTEVKGDEKKADKDTEVEQTEKKAKKEYDVDLTKLNKTMVYSEVYNMMYEPDTYIGKTVKMRGLFSIYQPLDGNGNPIPEQIYFACVILDATACCAQGLEFVLADDYTYPDDYPEPGSDIVVSGVFETYLEGDYRYCHLVDAVFE